MCSLRRKRPGNPLPGSASVRHLHAILAQRAEASGARASATVTPELWNMAMAVDPHQMGNLHHFGEHIIERLACADGRDDISSGGIVRADDLHACVAADWQHLSRAKRELERVRKEIGAAVAVNPRVYVGVCSVADAEAARLVPVGGGGGGINAGGGGGIHVGGGGDIHAGGGGGINAGGGGGIGFGHGSFDHPAIPHLRQLSGACRGAILRAIYLAFLVRAAQGLQ